MLYLNFTPFPTLTTKRLRLRQLDLLDENEIFILRTDENVNKYLDRPRASSISDAREFINKINAGISRNESIFWVITSTQNNQLIGTICLWNISRENFCGEMGFELLPAFQGKGIMQEALTGIINFGFGTMKLQAIEGYVDKNNNRSIRLLEKNGFTKDIDFDNKKIGQPELENMVVYRLNAAIPGNFI